MSICTSLLAFGVRQIFDVPVDEILHVIEKRMIDHGQALPKALARANDRAWQAVGLALAGEGLFERIKDFFRDGDLKGVRDQIKKFLDSTPTGLETANAVSRVKATEEWLQLRKAKRLSAESIPANVVAHRAATLERYSSPTQLMIAAHNVVVDTATALRNEAPHLADLLTASPANGMPLLAAAFGFFFRREVETNDELAHGLSFDLLRQLSDRQERGFTELSVSLGAHLVPVVDRLDHLFDALGDWFDRADAKLDEINGKLDQLIQLRDVATSTSDPLKVTVTNKGELQLIQRLRDLLRTLPPELVASADWSKLGDTLAAAGLFPEAQEAHESAAAAAKAAADRASEAEAEYKRFRDACETGDRTAAMSAFRRAIELDPERFTPFDLHRYTPEAVLGIGGFGRVFLADDQYVRVGKDRKVAIKAMHDSGWDTVLERDLSETFDEADTLTTLNHPGIIKTLNRGFGDPARRKRPFLVLEYFPGVTLDAWLSGKGPLPLKDVLLIAKQIAEAVHAAHQVGIYHRDIKPANVMVVFDEKPQRWQVKVIDFGLAVKLHVARTSMGVPSGRRAALDRSLAGTIRYAPPEQRNELDADVGPYSDVYAWGKTCLDLLFATTEPKLIHWKRLPDEYRDRLQALLERATLDDIQNSDEDHCRFPGFEPVLIGLADLLGEQPDRREKTPTPSVMVANPDIPFEPKIGDICTLRIAVPEPKHKPGEILTLRIPGWVYDRNPGQIMTVTIPPVYSGPVPGTLTTLTWTSFATLSRIRSD